MTIYRREISVWKNGGKEIQNPDRTRGHLKFKSIHKSGETPLLWNFNLFPKRKGWDEWLGSVQCPWSDDVDRSRGCEDDFTGCSCYTSVLSGREDHAECFPFVSISTPWWLPYAAVWESSLSLWCCRFLSSQCEDAVYYCVAIVM